ncbi:MAG TPA: dihydrofolate reductase [Kiritimatiellia bacterium]|nr:dihydrofolate reductase [Kiritimatiellia bacterium]HMO98405.1 dihydrofolate reductase [Kiritimatiellia bacterium]HMP96458.1 dihydrofolate reductase [Kiritimatiellia bacterium]
MHVSLIVALDQNGLIGAAGRLPWRLPADLRHFKALTMGKPILMGRKTCLSLGGPLPGRRNLVLTRNPEFRREGFECFTGERAVLSAVQHVDELVVIGGSDVYRLFLPVVRRVYVTMIHGSFTGDVWFPEWPLDPAHWQLVECLEHPADDKNPWAMSFQVYEKVEKI